MSYLQTAGNIILGVTYAVILLGWVTGQLMWSAPTHSVMVKMAGKVQMELSAMSMFLVIIAPAIFALLVTIARTIIGGG
jgi:hypothetical protein